MKKGPFKMKGSPMYRNFGIGSPMKKFTPVANIKANVKALGTRIKEKVEKVKDFLSKEEEEDILTKNIVDTSQKGDEEIREKMTTVKGEDAIVISSADLPETPSVPILKRKKRK